MFSSPGNILGEASFKLRPGVPAVEDRIDCLDLVVPMNTVVYIHIYIMNRVFYAFIGNTKLI